MFALFYSLYMSMFTGNWSSYTLTEITTNISTPLNLLGRLATSIFGEFQVTDLGSISVYFWLHLVSFILALITSIGIVVMAVKGIKRVFSIFFMPIR